MKNAIVTEEMIQNVKNKMQEIIDKNLEIKKIEMEKEKAREFIEKENTGIGQIQLENKQKEEVSFYFCEDYYNYFYGVMPISTSYIKLFDIMNYQTGFLIRYPNKKEPNVIKPYQEGKKLLATLKEYDDINKILVYKIKSEPKYDEKLYNEIYSEYEQLFETNQEELKEDNNLNNNKKDNTIYLRIDAHGNEYRIVGEITIPKISIQYPIIYETSEDYLKIAPTKLFGPDVNEVGNLCVVDIIIKMSNFLVDYQN